MLLDNLSTMLTNLAIALVMLFSGMQLFWASETLQEVRRNVEHSL